MQVGETSLNKSNSKNEPAATSEQIVDPKKKVEKAAMLANRILEGYRKEAEEKKKPEDEDLTKEKKTENGDSKKEELEKGDMPKEEYTSKVAGFKEFMLGLQQGGAPYLMKVASMVDPEFIARTDYAQGMALADLAIEKAASMQMEKTASDEQRAYAYGQQLAQDTIIKLAADIVAVRPIIQDLVAKGLLSDEESRALIDALASADILTPEVAQQAVIGLQNPEQVAAALIKAIEGTQGANVVPPPSTTVIPTPEALPASTPTADSAPPTTVTVNPVNMVNNQEVALNQKAEALLEAAGVTEPDADDLQKELIIQAALNVLDKQKKCK